MKITERELRGAIRRVISEMETVMGRGMKPIDGGIGLYKPSHGSESDHDECVKKVVDMLAQLDDPYSQWVDIEIDARKICKLKGVKFGPVMHEALEYFGIYYN